MPIPFLDLEHQHREVELESRAALARAIKRRRFYSWPEAAIF